MEIIIIIIKDNLLSKRLKQLNNEEMKSRLRHQRTSNELIYFLRECQKSTGYYSKLNELKQHQQQQHSGGSMSTRAVFDSSSLESTSFYNPKSTSSSSSSSSGHVATARRPLTSAVNKFRSMSYSNASPFAAETAMVTSRCGDEQQARGGPCEKKKIAQNPSIKLTAPTPPTLFIDTSSSNNNNSNSNAIAVSKTSTSRSSNSSSVFSSNSSESLVAESTTPETTTTTTAENNSNSNSATTAARSIKIQLRPTIIRPQTAQFGSNNANNNKLLFTKVSTPKILKNNKNNK